MKTQNKFFGKLITVLFALLIIACSKDDNSSPVDPPVEPPAAATFAEVIAVGNDPEPFPTSKQVSESDPVPVESDPDETVTRDPEEGEGTEPITERFVCTTKTVSVTDGNGSFPLFNPNANVIYPGSLIQGKTLKDATPSPIVVKRAGGTVSYNLNDGNPESSFNVDEVKKSSIQDGMNFIISNATGVVPANMVLDIIQIESEQQMALEMGLDISTFTTKVSADMSFSSEKTFNRTLVKLTQQYYTMSFDLPTSLEEIFDPSVTPEQLATYVQADNPATFISDVTYGRIFYMLIESTSSRKEMEAKLNVAYGAFNNKVAGELEVSAMEELKELKIKVIAYGGNAQSSFLSGETNINAIASKLAESTDIRAGLPLSYVARSVERPDKIVGTNISTEYDVVECELKGVLPPGLYADLVDLFEGGIGAFGHVNNSDVLVVSKDGKQYAWFNGNTQSVLGDKKIFDVSDPNGPLGGIELEDIGAMVKYNNTRLLIFDLDGFAYQELEIDFSKITENMLPSEPIGSYNENSANQSKIFQVNQHLINSNDRFFLSSEGIGSAVRIGSSSIALFSKDGNSYQTYNYNTSVLSNLLDTNDWFVGQDNSEGVQFDKVGASVNFATGNTGRYLFINETGDEIQEWYSNQSTPDFFVGPWVID